MSGQNHINRLMRQLENLEKLGGFSPESQARFLLQQYPKTFAAWKEKLSSADQKGNVCKAAEIIMIGGQVSICRQAKLPQETSLYARLALAKFEALPPELKPNFLNELHDWRNEAALAGKKAPAAQAATAVADAMAGLKVRDSAAAAATDEAGPANA